MSTHKAKQKTRKDTITRFFDDLDAPLKNQQWSWGATRRSDGAVFFRVWEDQLAGDKALLLGKGAEDSKTQRQGLAERREQIERVRAGAPCYLVVLKAVDTEAEPRKIEDFDRHLLLIGGQIFKSEGRTFIEIRGTTTPMAVRSMRPKHQDSEGRGEQ